MCSAKNKIFYERLCKRELSSQEIFEAGNNFVGFFDLLIQIDKRHSEGSQKSTKGYSVNGTKGNKREQYK